MSKIVLSFSPKLLPFSPSFSLRTMSMESKKLFTGIQQLILPQGINHGVSLESPEKMQQILYSYSSDDPSQMLSTRFNCSRDYEDYMNYWNELPTHPSSFKCLSRFDVFINHCGKDTKRNFAALLYDCLVHLKLHPFLDYKSMKPGDELEKVIESAIKDCKVGIVIFSPNYCTSDNCLNELALMVKCKMKVIPIFYDVETFELVVVDDGKFSPKQLHRFSMALEKAKGKVGISFDSSKGDWSNLLKRVSTTVVEILQELGG